jgi:hypothetical protein
MSGQVIVRDTDGSYASKSLADAGAVAAGASGGLDLTSGEMTLKSTVAGRGLTMASGVLSVAVSGKGAKVAISTAGAGTLTAAAIVSGLIMRTGPTGAYADTTDTATAILAAMDDPAVGTTFDFIHVNGVAYACTFTAGAGVTIAGTVNNAASKVRMYRLTVTDVGTPAVTITGIGEMVA